MKVEANMILMEGQKKIEKLCRIIDTASGSSQLKFMIIWWH